MTQPRIPRLKPFSGVLLTAILLTAAQVVLVPVAFGQNTEKGASSNEASGDTAIAGQLTLDLGKGVSMKLVLIPAGKFKMGNHDTPAATVKKYGGWMSWPGHPHKGRADQRQIDEGKLADEYLAHEVTISKPF